MIQLRAHFRNGELGRYQEQERRRRHADRASENDQKRKEQAADELDSDLFASAMTTIPATSEQIAAFSVKLDGFEDRLNSYDEATVAALMESEADLAKIDESLMLVETALQDMLKKAHVMDDGRRIFLTPEGTEAIDEFGAQVPLEAIDLDAVPPQAYIADQYLENLRLEDELLDARVDKAREIEAIHRFDERLQHARETHGDMKHRIEEGGLSQDDLDALEADLDQLDRDLLQNMPVSVRKHVPDIGLDAQTPDPTAAFRQNASPDQSEVHVSSVPAARAALDAQLGNG